MTSCTKDIQLYDLAADLGQPMRLVRARGNKEERRRGNIINKTSVPLYADDVVFYPVGLRISGGISSKIVILVFKLNCISTRNKSFKTLRIICTGYFLMDIVIY